MRARDKQVLAVTLLAFALRLAFLGRQSLWYDEAFSLAVARADWSTFWTALLTDGVHPPGYYLLLRGSLALFGSGEFALRYPSALAGTLAVPLIYQLGRLLGGRRWGLAAGLLLALNPFAIWYAQDARMYSLLLSLGLAVGYAFWKLTLRPGLGRWFWLVTASAISFLVHYFGFLFSLAQFVYLVASLRRTHRVLRWWAAAQAVASLPFLPWAAAIVTREDRNFGIGWIHAPTPLDMPLTLTNLAFALSDAQQSLTWASLALLVGVVAVGITAGLRTQYTIDSTQYEVLRAAYCVLSTRYGYLLIWLVIPIVFTWFLSLRLPLYVDRFFIICLPPWLLLISTISLSPSRLARGTMVVLLLASALTSARLWLDPQLAKEDWRTAAAYVQSREEPGDVLVMRDLQTGIPFGYYYRGALKLQFASVNRQTTPLEELARGYQRLWLVYRRPFEPTHALSGAQPLSWRDEGEPVVRHWLAAHETYLTEEATFPGVYVVLYRLAPGNEATSE